LSLSRLLLATYLFSLVGVGAELLLIGHFEDWPQMIPLVLIAVGIAAGLWHAGSPAPLPDRAFSLSLALMFASGLVGQVLHYRGNMEFELESDPAISGWNLFVASMTGATPALAPGTMALLAVVGYAYRVSRNSRQ
jgi:hypothetical protein